MLKAVYWKLVIKRNTFKSIHILLTFITKVNDAAVWEYRHDYNIFIWKKLITDNYVRAEDGSKVKTISSTVQNNHSSHMQECLYIDMKWCWREWRSYSVLESWCVRSNETLLLSLEMSVSRGAVSTSNTIRKTRWTFLWVTWCASRHCWGVL